MFGEYKNEKHLILVGVQSQKVARLTMRSNLMNIDKYSEKSTLKKIYKKKDTRDIHISE